MDQGWSTGDEGDEFIQSIAVDAVATIPQIAAAPDLLAAGQAVLASLDAGTLMEQRGGVVRDVAAVSRLRAAIAKAEGQP